MWAAIEGNLTICKMLINCDAKNFKTKEGKTAIDFAELAGRLKTAEYLKSVL